MGDNLSKVPTNLVEVNLNIHVPLHHHVPWVRRNLTHSERQRKPARQRKRQKDRQSQRQSQTETDRDRQIQTETDRQRQTERQFERDREMSEADRVSRFIYETFISINPSPSLPFFHSSILPFVPRQVTLQLTPRDNLATDSLCQYLLPRMITMAINNEMTGRRQSER